MTFILNLLKFFVCVSFPSYVQQRTWEKESLHFYIIPNFLSTLARDCLYKKINPSTAKLDIEQIEV